jgi:hypothetical protein
MSKFVNWLNHQQGDCLFWLEVKWDLVIGCPPPTPTCLKGLLMYKNSLTFFSFCCILFFKELLSKLVNVRINFNLWVRHTLAFSWERDANYPNFADIIYLEQGIIVSVGGFHKHSLPKMAGICAKSKETTKYFRSNCIHYYSSSIGDMV